MSILCLRTLLGGDLSFLAPSAKTCPFGSLGEVLPAWLPRRSLARLAPSAKTCPLGSLGEDLPFRSLGEDLSVWLTNLKSGPSA